jgi:hypothetical protein
MEKEIIETEISEQTLLSGYWEESDQTEIDDFIKMIKEQKKKGATHVSISTSVNQEWDVISFTTKISFEIIREETDEELNLRIKQEQEERQKEAEEKALFLKLKQKFEK